MLSFRFLRKKSDKETLLYLWRLMKQLWLQVYFHFSIVDKHAKILCTGTAGGLYPIKWQQTCWDVCRCGSRSPAPPVSESGSQIHIKGKLPQKMFFFLVLMKWNSFTIFLLVLFKSQDQFIFYFLFLVITKLLMSGKYKNLIVAVCLNEIELRHYFFSTWRWRITLSL